MGCLGPAMRVRLRGEVGRRVPGWAAGGGTEEVGWGERWVGRAAAVGGWPSLGQASEGRSGVGTDPSQTAKLPKKNSEAREALEIKESEILVWRKPFTEAVRPEGRACELAEGCGSVGVGPVGVAGQGR